MHLSLRFEIKLAQASATNKTKKIIIWTGNKRSCQKNNNKGTTSVSLHLSSRRREHIPLWKQQQSCWVHRRSRPVPGQSKPSRLRAPKQSHLPVQNSWCNSRFTRRDDPHHPRARNTRHSRASVDEHKNEPTNKWTVALHGNPSARESHTTSSHIPRQDAQNRSDHT